MFNAIRVANEKFVLSSFGMDVTVLVSEELGANLTGHEASYFMPSTTAATLSAFLAEDLRAKQIVVEESAHIYWLQRFHESAHAGGRAVTVSGGVDGVMPAEHIEELLQRTVWGLENPTA